MPLATLDLRILISWALVVQQIMFKVQSNRLKTKISFFFLWRWDPTRVMASSFLRCLDHTQRRTTVGRTPLNKWSARRRDLYLTTHNTHNRQTSMPLVGFEPTISAGERPQTYPLDRAATGTGKISLYCEQIVSKVVLTLRLMWTLSIYPLHSAAVFRKTSSVLYTCWHFC